MLTHLEGIFVSGDIESFLLCMSSLNILWIDLDYRNEKTVYSNVLPTGSNICFSFSLGCALNIMNDHN